MTENEKIIAGHQAGVVAEVKNTAQDICSGRCHGLRNLKSLRLQKFGSQKKLCDILGFDRTTYNSWELCKHWPKADAICMIAAALGCTIEELYREPEFPVSVLRKSHEQ